MENQENQTIKDTSEFFSLDKFDVYEVWNEAKHLGEDIVESEFGKLARNVLDEAGKVIGRVFVEVVENVVKEVADAVVEALTDKVEDIGKDVAKTLVDDIQSL